MARRQVDKKNEWFIAGDVVYYDYGKIVLPKELKAYQGENAIAVGDENANVVGHPFGFNRGKDLVAKIEAETKVKGVKPAQIVSGPDWNQFPK